MRFLKLRGTTTVQRLPQGAQGDGAMADADLEREQLSEMSFLDHLEELRWMILKSGMGIILMTVVCSFFSTWIIDVLLLGPTRETFFMYDLLGIDAETLNLQNRTITGQFFAYWGIVIVVGLILGSPIVVYQIWRFIEPGLYKHEKKGLRFVSVFATFFFMLGISFGYLIIAPLALQFFANFQISDRIVNEFDITKYFSMITSLSFGVGLLFELPVVVYFLAKLRILTAEIMRKSRKYALIVNLVIAAFITPPDPISQVLVAIPLLGLYELSIYIAAYVNRKETQSLNAALE
ncbi:MAG TPA: twin-arginine translocase subunit TatC [Rhodothermales bacterium]